ISRETNRPTIFAIFLWTRHAWGDGTFAIAYALMELVHEQQRAAEALDRLGLNYSSSTDQPGAVEKLAMHAERLARAENRTAGALEDGIISTEPAAHPD